MAPIVFTQKSHCVPYCVCLWLRTTEKGLGEILSSELAHDHRAWSASVRVVVNSIGDAPGEVSKNMPTLSYAKKASRSACEQLRPMGLMLSIPLRNSTKVPLFTGRVIFEK